jgi:hypothetical protein
MVAALEVEELCGKENTQNETLLVQEKAEYKKIRQTEVSKRPYTVVWPMGWSRLALPPSWCLPLRKAPGWG